MNDMKDAFEKAVYELEKFFQTWDLTAAQQVQMTKSLEYLSDFSEMLFADIDAYDSTFDRFETRLRNLGQTDAHVGEQTLENRLNIIEGGIQILEMSHLGHTNSASAEFKEMHGFEPFEVKGDILQRIEGIQKKVDKIMNLLGKYKIKMSISDILNL